MFEPENNPSKIESIPLPQRSRNLVTAVLLDHIKAYCEEFNGNF
jgi:hypothetical protein